MADTHPFAPATAARVSDDTGPFLWVDRLVTGYDLEGPRVRMGLLWFVAAAGAAVLGPVPTAAVFGLVGATAALQVASAWRSAGRVPSRLVAGVGALAMPAAALYGIGLAALAGLALVAAAVAASAGSARRRRRRVPAVVAAAATVRAGFFVGLAAASAVFLARTDTAAVVALVVLVSGYEVGDYLVGTGARTPVEGPLAGIAAVAALTFGLSVFQFPPFETGSAWVFGGLVAALAPLGRFVAPVLAPAGGTRVPALRRLDSYLITAPVWAWMLWGYLA